MQNPNSILWHNMEVLSAANGRTSGNQGGCPPDGTTIVDMPVTLERQGLPVAPELQSVQKKGRSEEETMIVEDTSMEGLGDAGRGPGDSPPVVMQSEARDPSLPTLSFKDKLLGNLGFSKQTQYVEELDMEVWDEDVRFGNSKENCGGDGVKENTQEVISMKRDPTELYGPRMQVVNRRRRAIPNAQR
ncbi:hypothetical protein V6N13_148687 [Hibiscus sabdariffa]